MKYDFKKAIAKAVEPVGSRAFHALVKTVTDGLPRGLLEVWNTDLTAREVTKEEASAAAIVSLEIEKEARLALSRLFLDDEFRSALTKDLQTGHGRKLAKNRKERLTAPFDKALRLAPDKPTKDLLNNLIGEGKLEVEGEFYLLVDPATERKKWKRYSEGTLNSKFSRLRKVLQNT